VRTRAGGLRVIDLPYHPDREGDDGYPERFASLENLPLSRPPLEMEGGHIQSDGAGNCIVTDDVIYMNAEYAYDEEDLRQILGAYLGCRALSFVPALVGEETGHVDVFAYVTGPRQVLVGAYALEDDLVNARRLNHTAGILRDAGWTVTRIRMPGNARRTVFRTHTNVVVTDHTVLVPVFRADRRFERGALRAFARAFPGRRVVPIRADDVMDLAGALHCTVIALPRRVRVRS
jgi:agmatine/peptidylarginine deiminase